MPENIIKNLGKAIKDARKSHNLTQALTLQNLYN